MSQSSPIKAGPFIMAEAFQGHTVYDQLEGNARAYINASKTITVSKKRGVTLPAPFEWHRDLFGGSDSQVMQNVKMYADEKLLKKLSKVSTTAVSYDFDWNINNLPSYLTRRAGDMFFVYLIPKIRLNH